jgi:uncharacterized protein (DUF2336 family)
VSSPDFRHIAVKGETYKADRLFRAAISAFCSLTRPSRREIDQLEDLALPLFDSVSVESRRFAAAALSECRHPPQMLVHRLSDETIDIAAPLLIRSTALSDVDLIALIGRHGLPHARAIARRPGLNKTIGQLVEALMSSAASAHGAEKLTASSEKQSAGPSHMSASNDSTKPAEVDAATFSNADRIRNRLRTMMRPAAEIHDGSGPAIEQDIAHGHFAKLRAAALAGDRTLFQTTLADALGIAFSLAKSLTEGWSYRGLATALRALDLTDEQAFLLAATQFPGAFGRVDSIRAFLALYHSSSPNAARERLQADGAEMLHQPAGRISAGG